MKLRIGFSLLLAVLAAGRARAQSAQPDLMTPGLWEITVQMEAPVAAPPSITEICIAKEKSRPAPPKSSEKDPCRVAEIPSPANEVAYTVGCSKMNRTTTVRFKYYGDRYEGTATTTESGVEIRTKYTARRIGACDASPNVEAAPEN